MSSSENNKEEFPVLKDIVKPGDESIIKTSRLGHEVIREIEELEHDTDDDLSPAEISRSVTEQTLEDVIDEVLDKHCQAMRLELREILAQIVANPGNNS